MPKHRKCKNCGFNLVSVYWRKWEHKLGGGSCDNPEPIIESSNKEE